MKKSGDGLVTSIAGVRSNPSKCGRQILQPGLAGRRPQLRHRHLVLRRRHPRPLASSGPDATTTFPGSSKPIPSPLSASPPSSPRSADVSRVKPSTPCSMPLPEHSQSHHQSGRQRSRRARRRACPHPQGRQPILCRRRRRPRRNLTFSVPTSSPPKSASASHSSATPTCSSTPSP